MPHAPYSCIILRIYSNDEIQPAYSPISLPELNLRCQSLFSRDICFQTASRTSFSVAIPPNVGRDLHGIAVRCFDHVHLQFIFSDINTLSTNCQIVCSRHFTRH